MRLLTGISFGMGVVWFGFHYIDEAFTQSNGLQPPDRGLPYSGMVNYEANHMVEGAGNNADN
jgi:hypothetical protein